MGGLDFAGFLPFFEDTYADASFLFQRDSWFRRNFVEIRGGKILFAQLRTKSTFVRESADP